MVLIVDDDRQVRERMVRVLVAAGAVVGAVADTEAAIRFGETAQFGIDVLITDLAVPQLGGLALVQRLRPRYRSLAVIVASGLADAAAACERAGAAFVRKPFSTTDLVGTVRRVLERRGPTTGEPGTHGSNR